MKSSNIFSKYKCTKKSTFGANFNEYKWEELLRLAHLSIIAGNSRALKIALADFDIFEDGTLNTTLLNKAVIAEFKKLVKINHKWNKKVRFFKSNRMVYCLVDREFFICFKALGKDGVIEGMDTKRFDDTIMGTDFSLNQKVLKELSKLSLTGIPPILFVGFSTEGQSISDVRFQYYFERELSLDFSFAQGAISKKSKFETRNKNNNNNTASDSDEAII